MIILDTPQEVKNKSNKYIVFVLNDHYDVKIRPMIFGGFVSVMALATVLVPYIALLTVPTYLAILFAVVSEKVDIVNEGEYDSNNESE